MEYIWLRNNSMTSVLGPLNKMTNIFECLEKRHKYDALQNDLTFDPFLDIISSTATTL